MAYNKLLFRLRVFSIVARVVMVLVCIVMGQSIIAQAQSVVKENEGFTLLQILPGITFLLALATGFLNLYIMNKLGKAKDEILQIVRKELNGEVTKLETTMGNMVTKEHLEFVRREIALMLKNIEGKIDRGNDRDTRNDNRTGSGS